MTLMEFPCDFQIKIMGNNSPSFIAEIIDIARKHFSTINDEAVQSKPSRQNNYLAISLTVHAQDQQTLDALYLDLTKHPDVKMVL